MTSVKTSTESLGRPCFIRFYLKGKEESTEVRKIGDVRRTNIIRGVNSDYAGHYV